MRCPSALAAVRSQAMLLGDLFYLHAVVRCGGITPAALLLEVSCQAVSQRIRRVEAMLACRLIASTRPLVLTAVGRRLATEIELTLLQIEKALDREALVNVASLLSAADREQPRG
jgi:DNA-binding transcriptional LysR family regulator